MENKYFILIIGLIVLLGFFVQPAIAAENSAEIFNDIRVKANTGNNSSAAGQIEQKGSASVEIEVNQTINGEKLPPINISTSSATGEPIKIEFYSENASGSVKVETKINAEVNTEANNETSSIVESLLFSLLRSLDNFRTKFYSYVYHFFK